MAHLVTGYAGHAHIKAADDGAFNASFFGGGQYVMEFGNCFEASIIDNNTVRILDGDGLMYGRHFRIEPNSHEDMIITTGTAGTNRIDLICMTYEKNAGDETESCYLQVIKGTETTGTAVAPKYTDGNILEGASFNQMPLYKVKIEGVVLKKIEPVFETIPTYKRLAERYADEFEAICEEQKTSISGLIPENNILVNSNFANPVNQRGSSGLSVPPLRGGYTIDRWKAANIDLKLENGFVSANDYYKDGSMLKLLQVIEFPEKYSNKTLTASLKYRIFNADASSKGSLAIEVDGNVIDSIDLKCDGTWTESKVTSNLGYVSSQLRYVISFSGGGEVQLEWAKLEEGAAATPYRTPLYSDELIRCGVPDEFSDFGYNAKHLYKADVVDNLLSESADLPLSASQGKKLYNRHLVVTALPSNPDPDTFYYIPE